MPADIIRRMAYDDFETLVEQARAEASDPAFKVGKCFPPRKEDQKTDKRDVCRHIFPCKSWALMP